WARRTCRWVEPSATRRRPSAGSVSACHSRTRSLAPGTASTIQSTSQKCSQVGAVSLVDPRDSGQVDGHEPSARHGEQCRTAEHPEPPTLAEARGGCIDHGLDQLGECGSLGHVAGRIDDDVVTGHHPGQVRRLIHNATSHAQVWRAQELGLVSHHRGDLVSARKRCSENALASVAGGAEEKDFHNRTSSLITRATGRSRLCCSSDCPSPQCLDGGPSIWRRLCGFPKAWFRYGSSSTSQSRFMVCRLVCEWSEVTRSTARNANVKSVSLLRSKADRIACEWTSSR